MKRLFPVLLLLFGGCAYDPPVKADHASVNYQHDLSTCQASALADPVIRRPSTIQAR